VMSIACNIAELAMSMDAMSFTSVSGGPDMGVAERNSRAAIILTRVFDAAVNRRV
jgi:hypothetical protein